MDSTYVFTQHALDRMIDYDIRRSDIFEAIKLNRVLPPKEKYMYPGYENCKRLIGKNDLIVITDTEGNIIRIITVFFSDKPLGSKPWIDANLVQRQLFTNVQRVTGK